MDHPGSVDEKSLRPPFWAGTVMCPSMHLTSGSFQGLTQTLYLQTSLLRTSLLELLSRQLPEGKLTKLASPSLVFCPVWLDLKAGRSVSTANFFLKGFALVSDFLPVCPAVSYTAETKEEPRTQK